MRDTRQVYRSVISYCCYFLINFVLIYTIKRTIHMYIYHMTMLVSDLMYPLRITLYVTCVI